MTPSYHLLPSFGKDSTCFSSSSLPSQTHHFRATSSPPSHLPLTSFSPHPPPVRRGAGCFPCRYRVKWRGRSACPCRGRRRRCRRTRLRPRPPASMAARCHRGSRRCLCSACWSRWGWRGGPGVDGRGKHACQMHQGEPLLVEMGLEGGGRGGRRGEHGRQMPQGEPPLPLQRLLVEVGLQGWQGWKAGGAWLPG